MKLKGTPTIEKINLDYNYIVPIFKGVTNWKALKDLGELMHLTIEINGASVYDNSDRCYIPEEFVNFVRIDSYESLQYIYFNYIKGQCVSVFFDVWSDDVDTEFITDVKIENLEKEYINGIKWVEERVKRYEEKESYKDYI